jgi:hypothetical protein
VRSADERGMYTPSQHVTQQRNRKPALGTSCTPHHPNYNRAGVVTNAGRPSATAAALALRCTCKHSIVKSTTVLTSAIAPGNITSTRSARTNPVHAGHTAHSCTAQTAQTSHRLHTDRTQTAHTHHFPRLRTPVASTQAPLFAPAKTGGGGGERR